MQQSNAIFAYLVIAYLLYITAKGEIGTYLTFLRGGGATATATTGSGSTGNLVTDGANALLGDNPFDAQADISTSAGSSGDLPWQNPGGSLSSQQASATQYLYGE